MACYSPSLLHQKLLSFAKISERYVNKCLRLIAFLANLRYTGFRPKQVSEAALPSILDKSTAASDEEWDHLYAIVARQQNRELVDRLACKALDAARGTGELRLARVVQCTEVIMRAKPSIRAAI